MPLSAETIESLYRTHAPEIEQLFRRAGYGPDEAFDAVNDTFAAAFRDRHLYSEREHRSTDAWLRLHAEAVRARRRHERSGWTPLDDEVYASLDRSLLIDDVATDALEDFQLSGDRIIERLLELEPRQLTSTIARIVEASPEFDLDVGRSFDERSLSLLRSTRSTHLAAYLRQELYAAQSRGHGLEGVLEQLSGLLVPTTSATLLGPDGAPLSGDRQRDVEVSIGQINAELMARLAREPELVHALTPRQFEEVLAEIFSRQGYEVRLTAATRDGGADLHVIDHQALGSFLYLVECKKYRPDRPVGVGIVRQLFGVVQATGATAGIVATTSYFTRDAASTARDLQYQLSLRDFAALRRWLNGEWA